MRIESNILKNHIILWFNSASSAFGRSHQLKLHIQNRNQISHLSWNSSIVTSLNWTANWMFVPFVLLDEIMSSNDISIKSSGLVIMNIYSRERDITLRRSTKPHRKIKHCISWSQWSPLIINKVDKPQQVPKAETSLRILLVKAPDFSTYINEILLLWDILMHTG